jgi:hypothetical protein
VVLRAPAPRKISSLFLALVLVVCEGSRTYGDDPLEQLLPLSVGELIVYNVSFPFISLREVV